MLSERFNPNHVPGSGKFGSGSGGGGGGGGKSAGMSDEDISETKSVVKDAISKGYDIKVKVGPATTAADAKAANKASSEGKHVVTIKTAPRIVENTDGVNTHHSFMDKKAGIEDLKNPHSIEVQTKTYPDPSPKRAGRWVSEKHYDDGSIIKTSYKSRGRALHESEKHMEHYQDKVTVHEKNKGKSVAKIMKKAVSETEPSWSIDAKVLRPTKTEKTYESLAESRSSQDRKIVKKPDGWHVYSEDGSKHLGGPYKTEGEAKKRLEQVDYFKNKGKKSVILTPERRVLPFLEAEIRVKRAENGERTITGYAAKFGKMSQNLGGFVEKIDKNAFNRVLSRMPDVMGLKNHSEHHILGRTKAGTMQLSVDDVGLRYDIAVPETVVGRDTVTEIERGDLSGSSFSFLLDSPDGDQWDDATDPPTRTLLDVRDLFDVGPVTYPAYLDTEASMRSYDQFMEARGMERELALNRKRAKILMVRVGLITSLKGSFDAS